MIDLIFDHFIPVFVKLRETLSSKISEAEDKD